MRDYKVELDAYNGPLDLLLFLIRRSEVDIYDIPISRITEQYITYVNVLKQIDPDLVGDFLVMAATLMEIKSRTLLPHPPAEEIEEEDFGDPRLELVRQLLEYKTFKDAARTLDAALEVQSLKHPRVPVSSLPKDGDVDLEEVQIWDLLDAFQKVLDAIGRKQKKHEVVYDDTPIALHAADLLDALERSGGSQTFQVLFEGRTKSQMIGLFLALLELIRQRRVRAVQPGRFEPIELQLLDASPIKVDEEADYRSAVEPAEPAPDIAGSQVDDAEADELDDEPELPAGNANDLETLSETFPETR